MTAFNTISIKGFTLEPAGEKHRSLAEQWTAWDTEHAGKIEPEFWLEQRMGVDSVLVLDGKGPVFFFKTCLWKFDLDYLKAEIFVQFMPCAVEEDRERVRTALIAGTEWFEEILKKQHAVEMFFDTRNEDLIRFCVKRLGFSVAGIIYQKRPVQKRPVFRLRKPLPLARPIPPA